MTGTSDDVELRIGRGLAGTQTVEVVASEDGASALRAALDEHDISYDVLDKRVEGLPGSAVLAIGSFHLGQDGSGLGAALQDFARRLDPRVPAVTIDGTPYELSEADAVASALVVLRTEQDQDDTAADEARATWERGYEQSEGAEDSEEPKE